MIVTIITTRHDAPTVHDTMVTRAEIQMFLDRETLFPSHRMLRCDEMTWESGPKDMYDEFQRRRAPNLSTTWWTANDPRSSHGGR